MSERKTAPLPFHILGCCRSVFRSDSLENEEPSATTTHNSTVDDVLKNYPYNLTSHRKFKEPKYRVERLCMQKGNCLSNKNKVTQDYKQIGGMDATAPTDWSV